MSNCGILKHGGAPNKGIYQVKNLHYSNNNAFSCWPLFTDQYTNQFLLLDSVFENESK